MVAYTQANRAIAITTPLGTDALLLEKVTGTEAVSELFRFQLDMLAPAAIDFARVLNQPASVRIVLPNGSQRLIHGIIATLAQGGMVPGPAGKDAFIRYTAELVPALWRLTRRVHSRVFQNLTVPKILEAVLKDDWQLDIACVWTGTYAARNYCTQYQESDFAFVSRLMEDEGIGYYFRHETDDEKKTDRHTLVLTDAPSGYVRLASGVDVVYQPQRGGTPTQPVVWDWTKRQEVPAGQHTLSDYHFQVPASRLLAKASVDGDVAVGQTTHALRFSHAVHDTEMLEVFAYPGAYAQRFDDIDALGKPRGKEMQKLHDDSKRTAKLRAQEAGASALRIDGAGSCAHFTPGNQFTLARHFDANGDYLLTRVEHTASIEGAYTSGDDTGAARYENRFQALPSALPYRPRRVTPRPRIDGIQTATVTGPDNVPIWIDLYGRVKIKFHWDRSGPSNGDSSCWVRVAQAWAGPGYGAFFWPRVDHEVVVSFEEGDPDRPLITGSVYNDQNLPPFVLPKNQYLTGIKSCSMGGDPLREANWLVFHDKPGDEHFHLHSEMNEVITSGGTKRQYTPGSRFEFTGNSAMNKLFGGSGSGGGDATGNSLICAAFPPPGSGSGGGIFDSVDISSCIAGSSKGKTGFMDYWEELFPGSSSFVDGTGISSIFFGDRISQTLLGAKHDLNIDFEGLLSDALLEKLMPVRGGKVGAILGGISGVSAFNVGSVTALTYGGPKLTVDRGDVITRKGEKLPPKPMRVLGLAIVAAALVTDRMARTFALTDEQADEVKTASTRAKIAAQKTGEAEAAEAAAARRKQDAQDVVNGHNPHATDQERAKAKADLAQATQDEAAAKKAKHAAEAEEKAAKNTAKPIKAHEKKVAREWMILSKKVLITRMTALLYVLENLHGEKKAAEQKKNEAARIVKHMPLNLRIVPNLTKSVFHCVEQTGEILMQMVHTLAGGHGHSKGPAPEYDVKKGDYSLSGRNITIFSRNEKDGPLERAEGIIGGPTPEPTTTINLIAEGGAQELSPGSPLSSVGGIINILATKQVFITQDKKSYMALVKDKGIEIHAPKKIKIWTRNEILGPRIVMTDKSIKLIVGSELTSASYLEVTESGISAVAGASVIPGPCPGLHISKAGVSKPRYLVKLPGGAHLSYGPWCVGATDKDAYGKATEMHAMKITPTGVQEKHLLMSDSGSLSSKSKDLMMDTKHTLHKDGSSVIIQGS